MKTNKLNFIKEILIIAIGNLCIVISANVFLLSADLYPTGLIGISTEISQIIAIFTNIDISYNVIYLLLNIPIVILGYFKVGKKFILKTVISILFFFVLAAVIPPTELIPINSSGDQLISSFVAAIFMGSGIGLLLKVGSSSGGIDIIAVYISLSKGKSFGLYNLLMNLVVIVIAIILSQNLAIGALTLINLYIVNAVVDTIHNEQEKRLLVVVTNKADLVTEEMYKNIFRGITILESTGGYSKQNNKTLMITISYGELYHALSLIHNIDKKAFINVLKADNVIGNFENPYQKGL